MDTIFIIFGCAVFFFSALLQGLSGFGFSILAIPLITLILTPKNSVPILLIYSIIINIVVLISSKRSLDIRKLWPLLISALIAIPLGTKILIYLPEKILRGSIGGLILVFGFLLLSGLRIKIKHEKLAMLPIGFLSGILEASISISGPPVIIYLTNQQTEKQEFRSNLALYFFILNLITIPVYYVNGLFTKQVISNALTFLPALVCGVIIGNLLSHKIKDSHFRKVTLYLLIIMGITAIVSVII